MDDIFDDVFALIRLKGCVYFQHDFYSPWAMRIENTGHAQFHIVTRGRCIVETGGATAEVSSGDLLLFPRGAAHTLADAPDRRPLSGPQVMASLASEHPAFASGTAPVRLICGHYEYRQRPAHPLIAGLPDMLHIPSLDLPPPAAPQTVLSLILEELNRGGPGAAIVTERLAEVLLVQILRAHIAENPNTAGFLQGAADRRLSRALVKMHREYARTLSLSDLARSAGMSRSGFARHFKDTTGLAPIEYLAKWRMLSAGDLLKDPGLPVREVARQSGYESEIAFARAFKREFGLTPGQYRRQPGRY